MSKVCWIPWSAHALALARDGARPLFLHVSYAGCEGSEAMARESFDDDATAALLNEAFVCVRIDRDALPALDRSLQLAHRLLTREDGGWPLNVFLTHDEALPFFGGGYFPPEARAGQPAFRSLLSRVADYHRHQGVALREQGAALRDALARIDAGTAEGVAWPGTAPLDAARRALEKGFDRRHGGWGQAPKFPQVLAIQHLLHQWRRGASGEQPDLQALFMATFTLTRIAEGALHDSRDGGFYRYCHDAAWREPQREKSLVDNAQLLEVFAETALLTGDAAFRQVAESTADALLRHFARADGGFRVTAARSLAAQAEQDAAALCIGPNAVAAKALTLAGRWLGRADLDVLAGRTLDLLRERPATTLDEHARLADAVLHRHLPGSDEDLLDWALQLADAMLERFEDVARGGFFATALDGLPMFHRARDFADSGLASGNALAAQVLLRLSRLQALPRHARAAERTLRAAATRLTEQPLAHLGLLDVLVEASAATQAGTDGG